MFNKIFTDLIKSKTFTSFLVGLFMVVLYHFLIFPGLTVANTIINILSAILGVISLMFLVFYVKHMYLKNQDFELFTPDPNKTPETELDYIPPKKKTTKRRTTPKQTIKTKKQNK
jgi:fatty acid desaturase